MLELSTLSKESWSDITILLTDIDDTISTDGRLTSDAYAALEALNESGYTVVPVTGRCAGWCDHIARMWPVSAIVGENGAFYFRYDHSARKMHQYFSQDESERRANARKLEAIVTGILAEVPGTAVASDQPYRLTDVAIDFCEDVARLPESEIQRIATLAEAQGAVAKISSIHVNCWFGEHTKLATSLKLLNDCFNISGDDAQSKVMFVGDSPNDETMFGHFEYSVGVANVLDCLAFDFHRPAYVTRGKGGAGFTELARYLLDSESGRGSIQAKP